MKQLQSNSLIFAPAAVIFLMTQPVWAQTAKVTAVRLNPTNGGFNVVLETAGGQRPQVFTSTRGNTLVADVINTKLSLPQGNIFRQDNPAPGVTSVVVNQLDPNSIRMVITGSTTAPKAQITQRDIKGVTLSISPVSGTASTPPSSAPSVTQNTPTVAPSPPPGQTSNALVPNPDITISQTPTSSVSQAPPVLPRAIAPPVGDIAVSTVDSSPSLVDLGTSERVPRLVLRDAPVREVLALLARAAGLNLAFSTAAPPGTQPEAQPTPGVTGTEGPTISLDIQDESVQNVFNYVLRLTGLQANRSDRTIFVGTRLPNQARDVIVRSLRLNQVTVGVALNFLVGMGAESAVSRERTITSVNAVPVGGAATPATQTQTTTETRIETQRIDLQDSIPLLRGLEALGDERTNSVTLIGTPKQIDVATAQLIQLDSRRRQVAVNVKIIDVNLAATENFNTSFSFGIGDTFFSNDGGSVNLNYGGVNPPSSLDVTGSRLSPPVTAAPFPPGVDDLEPFLNPQTGSPFDSTRVIARPPFGTNNNPFAPGITQIEENRTEFGLPQLFQYPQRFLSTLRAQVVSGNAKILTDPTLIVQEGQQANVNLTQQVVGNITREITDTAGGSRETFTVEKEQVGLTLSIRIERLDDNGFISLSVAPVVRVPQAPVVTENGTIFLVSERSLNSGLVRLRDNQTLILSGIIQDQDRSEVSKVPILGDIPILGALFRRTNRVNERREVIVLLTPQMLDDSDRSSFGYNYTPSPDARQLLERQQQR